MARLRLVAHLVALLFVEGHLTQVIAHRGDVTEEGPGRQDRRFDGLDRRAGEELEVRVVGIVDDRLLDRNGQEDVLDQPQQVIDVLQEAQDVGAEIGDQHFGIELSLDGQPQPVALGLRGPHLGRLVGQAFRGRAVHIAGDALLEAHPALGNLVEEVIDHGLHGLGLAK
jgi:hypothetical protein